MLTDKQTEILDNFSRIENALQNFALILSSSREFSPAGEVLNVINKDFSEQYKKLETFVKGGEK